MRIKLCVPKEYGKKVRDRLVQNIDTVETEEWDTGALEMVTICCIFRDVVLEETYIESSGNFQALLKIASVEEKIAQMSLSRFELTRLATAAIYADSSSSQNWR